MSWFRSGRRRQEAPESAVPDAPEEVTPEVSAVPEPATGQTAAELAERPLADLHALAREQGVLRYRLLRKEELIGVLAPGSDVATIEEESEAEPIEQAEPEPESEPEEPESETDEGDEDLEEADVSGTEERAEGILELTRDGFGFVRTQGLFRSDDDPFLSRTQVRRLGLRTGDEVAGIVRPPRRGERHPAIVRVDEVNGTGADALDADRPSFDDLQIARPDGPLRLERGPADLTGRMIDLVAPVGRGQRGLISGPPGAGASTILREVARALPGDDPYVIVVLCDVRPEELLDWDSSEGLELHPATGERSPKSQSRIAQLALERAKRLAEAGRDVVLLLDSITRLARAHSLAASDARSAEADAPLDGAAVHAVKRVFASARNTSEAGSLTILAAVRSGSESRFDEAVYESLADAANIELLLDAELAERGSHPALDLTRSRTIHEAGLVDEAQQRQLELLRGVMRSLDPAEAWNFLAGKLRETGSNEELVAERAG